MNGYGSHAYMWVNAAGEKYWVKYHFHTEQGMAFFSNAEPADMAGSDADCHRRDLFEAIARGAHPRWRVTVQGMPYAEPRASRINQFDPPQVCPPKAYPLIQVGHLKPTQTPINYSSH